MKFLSSEKLSQHKYKTPEGYLICVDAILARTGKQTYRKNEVFADSEDDSEIEVDRKPEEVFSPTTLASFENKPITVEHPDEDVNAGNYNELSVGFVRDVHKGVAEGQDVMLGTLVITDAQTIEEIENGEHTDLSCGYDCDIIDEENPQQRNIRGNHVALCQCGRAGIARIVDSTKINDSKYIVHFKHKNGGEDKDIVVEAKGMREAVEIAKTYVSDYYYRYVNVKPYFGDSVQDTNRNLNDIINHFKTWGYPSHSELQQVVDFYRLTRSDMNVINEALGYEYTNDLHKLKYHDSVKDTEYRIVNYNNNWYYEIKQDDGFTKLVGPYDSKEEAKEYFMKHRPNEKLKDAQSIMFRGENTFIFANKDMIPERTHYKGDVEYNGKEYYYHEGFDTKRKYLVPINDSTDDSIDRNKIEQIIKSRQFELRKNGNKIQEYIYKGKEEDKKYNFEELAKALPANVGLALSGDELSVAFRDALIQSSSEEAFKKNISTEIRSGKSSEQAAAIAHSIKRKNDSKKYEISYIENDIEHIHIVRAKDLKDAIQKSQRR